MLRIAAVPFVVLGAGSSTGYTCSMSHTIPAVFDSGVFRPLEPVDLAEGTRAEVIPLPQPATAPPDGSAGNTPWPSDYFVQTAGGLAGEPFERPPQGELPNREGW